MIDKRRTAYPFICMQRCGRRALQPTDTRDEMANRQLVKALEKYGYAEGEPLFNAPTEEATEEHLPEDELLEVDASFTGSGDRLAMTTRPALSDPVHGDKKRLVPGNTQLERIILKHWLEYLTVLSRSHARFSDAMAPHLLAGYENRLDITFRQKGHSAFYYWLSALTGLRSKPERANLTAAFLLHLDELWPGGPGFVSAWGMNAVATLVWCCQLRHRFPELLAEPGFTVVELEAAAVPARPTNLRWAMEWKVGQPILAYRP